MNIDEATALSQEYFGDAGGAGEIHASARFVLGYKRGVEGYGRGSLRKATLMAAGKHARGLQKALGNIDQKTLAETMGESTSGRPVSADIGLSFDSDPESPRFLEESRWSYLPHRLEELAKFRNTLNAVSSALETLASGTPLHPGRPESSDPLLIGLQDLARLWKLKRGKPPTLSKKRGEFLQLAHDVFCTHCGYTSSEISTGARRVVEGSVPPAS